MNFQAIRRFTAGFGPRPRADTKPPADHSEQTGLVGSGQPATSAQKLHEALTQHIRVLGELHPQTAQLRCELAYAYQLQGDLGAARREYEQVLVRHRHHLEGDDLATSRALSGLGDVLRLQGDRNQAWILLHRALFRQQTLLGADPTTAQTHTRLGVLFFEERKFTTARKHFEAALQMRQETLPANHPAIGQSLHNLGITWARMGDTTTARKYLELAVNLRERTPERDDQATARSLEALSDTLMAEGDHDQAMLMLEHAVELYRTLFGSEHTTVQTLTRRLADYRPARFKRF